MQWWVGGGGGQTTLIHTVCTSAMGTGGNIPVGDVGGCATAAGSV